MQIVPHLVESDIEVAQEPFDDRFLAEVKPIASAHIRESVMRGEEKSDPDFRTYRNLFDAGFLRLITARKNQLLIGYLIASIGPSLRSKGILEASHDVFYIKPSERSAFTSRKMLDAMDAALRESGARFVRHNVMPTADISILLKRNGYTQVGTIYRKEL